ncbi:MAG: hypothetical protein R3D00_09970 [Bacteroidia bacterium]
MKKIISIFLGLFYLILSVGVNVNYHYCLGKLDTIEIFITDTHRCCDYEARAWSCCEDERFFFQLDEDHNLTQADPLTISLKVSLLADFSENLIPDFSFSEARIVIPPENAPPPVWEKAWLRFCSPIIYG